MAFTSQLRLAYSRTFYGTGYFIYHQFVKGALLTRPIVAWQPRAPAAAIPALLSRAGTDIAPLPGADITERSGSVQLNSEAIVLVTLERRRHVLLLDEDRPAQALADREVLAGGDHVGQGLLEGGVVGFRSGGRQGFDQELRVGQIRSGL